MTPSDPAFRVVVFSSADPAHIRRLVERIHREVPGARVCGVLSERRPQAPPSRRLATLVRNLGDPAFLPYVARRVAATGGAVAARLGGALLAAVHGGRSVAAEEVDLESVRRSLGCAVKITSDYHAEDSLAFVRDLEPDLGIVYGTRILEASLFAIPKHGSINIHKRKVPDYRGGGPIGLWELLDGQQEIGVTVHEVTAELDAGQVVNAATIAIEPYDTLTSLALKAHVVGNDLLVRSVADYVAGTARRAPQQGTGKMFRSPTPPQLARYERMLARQRAHARPRRSRSVPKLIAKTLLGLPRVAIRNGRRRRRGAYPVTILFHHLVADRPHRLGISTDQFLAHVRFLRRHYRIVSLTEAVAMLEAGRVDAPTVVLTFDDGYAENFLTLRAIVEETGVPITLFVCTEHLASGREFAHDLRAGEPGFRPLTWAQVEQMHRDGFEIASHSRTHFDCGSRDRTRLTDEILGSRHEIEQRLGLSVSAFSFPGGLPHNMSPEATALASAAYPHVLSAYGGTNEPGEARHLKRAFHVADRWELELQIQGVLERGVA